ncbi:Ig-like domain-containing protein [Tersicoccus sp. MR15.9]|uniref:L,D-transpeptidase n=1 Tax=Tersicoccus mangrovi TaxID=3121635 RepID=UPI002FE58A7E
MSSASSRPQRGRISLRLAALAAAAGLVVSVSGCTTSAPTSEGSATRPVSSSATATSSARPTATATATPTGPVAPVTVTTAPVAGSFEVNPATPVTVKAAHGTLTTVSLTATDGTTVAGSVDGAGTTWTSGKRLAFNTGYTLAWTTKDAAGATKTGSQTFSTVVPQNEADALVYPGPQLKTVGIGQPIQFTFSEPVLNRDAVEKAISITSSAGQKGDFHWYSNQVVRFRAPQFWKAHSTVTIDAKLFGVDFGNGQIGNTDIKRSITIGDARIAVADDKTKHMIITVNGKKVRDDPVTLGDADWPSTYGTKVIMDQYATTQFNASTLGLKPGDPHYYPPLTVHNASRLTNGGEFIHQALPSAVPYLGKINVSHGCIGMSAAGAGWVYQHMTTGDVVMVKNTGYGPMEPTDGFGDWNIPWAKWAN